MGRRTGKGPYASLILGLWLAGCDSGTVPQAHPAEPAEVQTPSEQEGPIQFSEESVKRGIDFTHLADRTEARLMPEILGGGVAVVDFNGDGAPDIYLVGGGKVADRQRPQAARDRLYLNDGKGFFRDATLEWGVQGVAHGMGIACGDFDNDGWTDVLLTGYGGGERLLRNTGTGFEDVTAKSGLEANKPWGMSAGFFDCDLDGDLDIYVVRYLVYDHRTAIPCWNDGRPVNCSPGPFEALADSLFINNGDGTFRDGSAAAGVSESPGKGLALALGDLDWDGDVDIYVANDSTRNQLYMNDGSGVFKDRATTSGVAYDETGNAAAGMGADFSDVDRNGTLDIVCTNFQDETTNIYIQRPLGVYRDQSYALGVGAGGRQRLSFGVDFFDVDNDGDEDLFVANGHVEDNIGLASRTVTFEQQNTFYRLDEGGHFTDISNSSGPPLRREDVTRAVASGDLDGDGSLDLVLTNNDGSACLLMNRSENQGQGAAILWLVGKESNRSAIGARIETANLRREVRGASSYLAQCDQRVHIGLGDSKGTGRLRILWPSGEVQEIDNLEAGFYRVVETEAPVRFVPGQKIWAPR